MKVNFDKEGINAIINKITYDACGIAETEPGRFDKVIKMSFNGIRIEVPCCADNANAIEYMLKDMLISEITGEATQGNLKTVAAEMDKRFEALFE